VDPVDPRLFREAMSRFASGVTVVTARRGEERVGLTASSFASVSLDPPLVLVCVARSLQAHTIIEESRAFGVNILGVHQLEAALRFAGLKPETTDRFGGLDWTSGVTGSPLLGDSIASLDCRLHATHPGGDHTIFVGEVAHALISRTEAPLLYHQRLWHRPEALPSPDAPEDVPRT
jgi:flavin reductase (DIM6/NTAB) family NADH-FMN oxidoreductase RutF